VGVARSSQRYQGRESDEEEQLLIERMTELALQYGRYGYRRIAALLRNEGWEVNHKRIERPKEGGGVEGSPASTETEAVVAE
jgi:transposase InsO family protein